MKRDCKKSGRGHEKMVKFGKPEATPRKTREEENSCGRVWERDDNGGRGMRKGEGATREVLRVDDVLGRKNRRGIRDKETNIDNEKTSMAKKKARWRSERKR